MDVLDKYKETWKNQPDETNKVSKVEIYKMTHKKSTSVVKWIFIIGILEFIFVATLNILMRISPNYTKFYDKMGKIIITAEFLSYVIIVYFLFRFYKNYKNISISENTKNLMLKILKTRRTVKNYIITVLVTNSLFLIPVFTQLTKSEEFKNTKENFHIMLFVAFLIISIIIFFFYWLFYQLIYGILLRKLKHNYKELSKLETE